jgi:hypothetical protein
MHEAKINFLDHSPGNTLIIKKDNGDYDFYLVDLNRMKFEVLSKTMIEVIALKYAELSNEPFEKLKMLLRTKSSSFKRKTARKKYFKRFIGRI